MSWIYDACNIIQHDRSGSRSVKTWGGISLQGCTALLVQARGNLTAVRYRVRSSDPSEPYDAPVDPGLLLMQNNDRPHALKSAGRFWMMKTLMLLIDLSVMCLNSNEHLWCFYPCLAVDPSMTCAHTLMDLVLACSDKFPLYLDDPFFEFPLIFWVWFQIQTLIG